MVLSPITMSLWGWYANAFAAEPFVVSAVATYFPILLEQLARQNAVWVGDRRTPCGFVPDLPGLVPPPISTDECVVRVFYWYIDTSSLPLYTFSISVFVQTILVVSISGFVDRSHRVKKPLVGFGMAGALSTIFLSFISAKRYYLAALLAVVANACFGAVSVLSNAILPRLAREECKKRSVLMIETPRHCYGTVEQYTKVDENAMALKISGTGIAIGYCAALIVQTITMALLMSGGAQHEMIKEAIAAVGAWWLFGQVFIILWLIDFGSEDDEHQVCPYTENTPNFNCALTAGWMALINTFIHAKTLPDVAMFLISWFILSDAITTINSTAILFARANLNMAAPELAAVSLLMVCFAACGSLLASRMPFEKPNHGIVAVAIATAAIPLYGVTGFFNQSIGLWHPWEMYILAAWYGVALGALNSICRSAFALMIPLGKETMFFALYSVTDKSSSVLGPALTGLITDQTHNIRYTFFLLLFMLLLAAFLFSFVDVGRGEKTRNRVDANNEFINQCFS